MKSDIGIRTLRELQEMDACDAYNTQPSYRANTLLYPTNLVPFVEKHMFYLHDRPKVDPEYYIANLRLITKIR